MKRAAVRISKEKSEEREIQSILRDFISSFSACSMEVDSEAWKTDKDGNGIRLM